MNLIRGLVFSAALSSTSSPCRLKSRITDLGWAVDITIDGVIDLDDETVEEEIRLALNAFADFLVDNFFLPLKAAGSKTPQPSPAVSSRITSTRPVVGSVE
ncbi:uncharacterized protein FRV6_16682 [Fusarium oxysporum]|uniref:Uncharacterized protein n=1 Tax=Fusarium oxysporum TaxID=5507 RepID=A0A2H3TVC0_FUSOX|nr:uncharacterized protein FRV6_16682 [Fusarium oxysporum]